MTLILGANISNSKHIFMSIQSLYGINHYRSIHVLAIIKICGKKNPTFINKELLREIVKIIEISYLVEGNLKIRINTDIKNIVKINSYKGIRHLAKLPVRGQRTRTNAKTCKKITFLK